MLTEVSSKPDMGSLSPDDYSEGDVCTVVLSTIKTLKENLIFT